jgi:hypothetical protein
VENAMSEQSVLICWPIAAGEPKAESFVSECDDCGCAIWRAFSSPDTDIVLCSDCASKDIQEAQKRGVNIKFDHPTKEQTEEARWWLKNFGTKES